MKRIEIAVCVCLVLCMILSVGIAVTAIALESTIEDQKANSSEQLELKNAEIATNIGAYLRALRGSDMYITVFIHKADYDYKPFPDTEAYLVTYYEAYQTTLYLVLVSDTTVVKAYYLADLRD